LGEEGEFGCEKIIKILDDKGIHREINKETLSQFGDRYIKKSSYLSDYINSCTIVETMSK